MNQFQENSFRRFNISVAFALTCFMLLSSVAGFAVYRQSFSIAPWAAQQTFAAFIVIVEKIATAWLLYGFTRKFSSQLERIISGLGVTALLTVMLLNLTIGFRLAFRFPLGLFEQAWASYAVSAVFTLGLIAISLVVAVNAFSPAKEGVVNE